MIDAIIVIGMHRCGTSTISGMLCQAGYRTGKNPQETDFFNLKGYFENTRFGIFNNELMACFAASWCDTLRIHDKDWSDPILNPFREQLLTIIKEEFTDGSSILIKDPRISILLPFYLEVFQRLNIRPKFIICFRNPLAVALSLKMRNNLSFSRSFAIWMDHLLKAERFTRNNTRWILNYDDILKDPAGILKSILHKFSPVKVVDPIVENSVTSFVDPKLRHHEKDEKTSDRVPEDVNALFSQLLSYRYNDQDSQFKETMDQQYDQFYTSTALFTGQDAIPEVMLQTVAEDKSRVTRFLPCNAGNNHFEFNFDTPTRVKHLIFLPFNHRSRLRCNGFTIFEVEKPGQFLNFSYDNAKYKSMGNEMTFHTVNPEVGCHFYDEKTIFKVSIDMELLEIGDIVCPQSFFDDKLPMQG